MTQEIQQWFASNGDDTHLINYDLNENSTIMDLGGYTGVWIEKMIKKYNPTAYAIEPIKSFFEIMENKFNGNNKVNLVNLGVSNENKKSLIYLSGDGSSSRGTGNSEEVELVTMDNLLDRCKLNNVDLLQINIEGEEYPLLEHMLETGSINRFKNIQIQFHGSGHGFDFDPVSRRRKIQNGLIKNGFIQKYNFEFVWESWQKIK